MIEMKPRGYEDIKELAAAEHTKVESLLVLARQNDPFFAGAPAQRTKAEWFARLWRKYGYRDGVHLRRVHYQIVSNREQKADGTPYQNTDNCWNYLCEAAKAARYLRLVRVDSFVDRRNPPAQVHVTERWDNPSPEWRVSSPDWILPEINVDLADDLELEMPEPYVNGYDYEDGDQPVHCEVWCEKSTMNDVLEPLCRQMGANFVTSLGFQSITSVADLLGRARAAAERGRPTRILYISDYDPAGDAMPVAVARQVEYWQQEFAPEADIALQPIVLTKAQVRQYRLPTIPIKESDLRAANFEARTGMAGAVELDALEALHPGVLAEIVREAIEPYRDTSLNRRLREARAEAQTTIGEEWKDATEEERERLGNLHVAVRRILGTYKERLQALHDELAEELAPYQEALDNLAYDVNTARNGLDVELPERPGPERDDADESEWLFASSRDYEEQLGIYQARKRGETY